MTTYSKALLWFDGRDGHIMAVYGVDKEVSSYASLFKRWGGGKWSVKIRSKTIKTWSIFQFLSLLRLSTW